MTIPRIIHVCWFGGATPDRNILRCEASRTLLTDLGYEIKIWTENNYDLNKSMSLKKAYADQKWSLVSNYVRLDVLKEFGGIYIDADVEIITGFDDLLNSDFFIGFMWDCTLGTAVIGSSPMNKIVCDILDHYDASPSLLISPNNNTFTDYFLSNVNGFELTGIKQFIGTVTVLDKFAFEHPTLFCRKNYTIHHFSQSWINSRDIKIKAKNYIISIFSLWLYRKYICYHSKMISPYYKLYLEHKRKNRLSFDS